MTPQRGEEGLQEEEERKDVCERACVTTHRLQHHLLATKQQKWE